MKRIVLAALLAVAVTTGCDTGWLDVTPPGQGGVHCWPYEPCHQTTTTTWPVECMPYEPGCP